MRSKLIACLKSYKINLKSCPKINKVTETHKIYRHVISIFAQFIITKQLTRSVHGRFNIGRVAMC